MISLQEKYCDVYPELRTNEQYYIEYVTGFFLEMCGQQVSSIVWYFERYTANNLPPYQFIDLNFSSWYLISFF